MFMKDFTRLVALDAVPALPVAAGLAAGTPVETRAGWRPVETLAPGDAVHTLDGGLRRIAAVDRAWLMPAAGAEVLRLSGGAFGNCDDLALLPGQHLLIDLGPEDMAAAGELPDALGALIPAEALEGMAGVRRARIAAPLQVVSLVFAEEEIVWAASGVLLHCPSILRGPGSAPEGETFPRMTAAAARRLFAARAQETAALPGWMA